MAKPDKMPQQTIIDGFKGLIDFYYWKGIAVARRWPRYYARTPTAAEAVNQTDFAYINKLYSTLPAIVIDALQEHATGTTQVAKDYLVRAYLKGLFELMPPEYYATEETQLALLAQLDVALSTRALEAGGNLAAILAQLDVALSTRALEAGGNLEDILTRLNAILLTRGTNDGLERFGILATGAGWTTVANFAGRGVITALFFATDYSATEIVFYLDTHNFDVYIPDGSGPAYLSPARLNALGGESSYFQESLYDDPGTKYSLFLKKDAYYTSTVTVRVRQQSGVNKNVACKIYFEAIT